VQSHLEKEYSGKKEKKRMLLGCLFFLKLMLNEQDLREHHRHQQLHHFLHELFLIKHQDMMIWVS
jgi:hypothetical protein